MEARIADLRYRMKSVLEALDRGETVTILYRGKPRAQLTPIAARATDHPFFGMWKGRKDMEDVNAYVRGSGSRGLPIFDSNVLILSIPNPHGVCRRVRSWNCCRVPGPEWK